jgi:hypothetical protein
MDFSSIICDAKSSILLKNINIISKIIWMAGRVTYEGVIPPKGFGNSWPNLEIEN